MPVPFFEFLKDWGFILGAGLGMVVTGTLTYAGLKGKGLENSREIKLIKEALKEWFGVEKTEHKAINESANLMRKEHREDMAVVHRRITDLTTKVSAVQVASATYQQAVEDMDKQNAEHYVAQMKASKRIMKALNIEED